LSGTYGLSAVVLRTTSAYAVREL